METLTNFLLEKVRQVRNNLNLEPLQDGNPDLRFKDVLDSMGMVEFLLCVAEDCERTPDQIETCVERRFGTIGELAIAMHQAGISPKKTENKAIVPPLSAQTGEKSFRFCWIAATACRLGDAIQPAAFLDERLGRPSGWLERHAGIRQRHVWDKQDPLISAVDAANQCLHNANLTAEDVGGLLVTSEAPPLLTGLAAALHHHLKLPEDAVALEIGNACTGFLTALWLARQLSLPRQHVLIIALETPSPYLHIQPGPSGENAALFGDAAAATLLSGEPKGTAPAALVDVVLGTDGSAGDLIQVAARPGNGVELHLQGQPLATRAVDAMAGAIQALAKKHGLSLADIKAVVMHAGNGRFPALLAQRLHLPLNRFLSQTLLTGNLGSASLPVAWAMREELPSGPVIWTAVGAGLHWGAALVGVL
jgi:3-oxoacyl-[acyl-carrier-protein] synthase-3